MSEFPALLKLTNCSFSTVKKKITLPLKPSVCPPFWGGEKRRPWYLGGAYSETGRSVVGFYITWAPMLIFNTCVDKSLTAPLLQLYSMWDKYTHIFVPRLNIFFFIYFNLNIRAGHIRQVLRQFDTVLINACYNTAKYCGSFWRANIFRV